MERRRKEVASATSPHEGEVQQQVNTLAQQVGQLEAQLKREIGTLTRYFPLGARRAGRRRTSGCRLRTWSCAACVHGGS
jgi:hypothetical protein